MCTCPQLIVWVDLHWLLLHMWATVSPAAPLISSWLLLLCSPGVVAVFPYRSWSRFWRLRIHEGTLWHSSIVHHCRIGLVVQCWLLIFRRYLSTIRSSKLMLKPMVAKRGLGEHRLELLVLRHLELMIEKGRATLVFFHIFNFWRLQPFEWERVGQGLATTWSGDGVVRVRVMLRRMLMNIDHQIASIILRSHIVWYAFTFLVNHSARVLNRWNHDRSLSWWHNSKS